MNIPGGRAGSDPESDGRATDGPPETGGEPTPGAEQSDGGAVVPTDTHPVDASAAGTARPDPTPPGPPPTAERAGSPKVVVPLPPPGPQAGPPQPGPQTGPPAGLPPGMPPGPPPSWPAPAVPVAPPQAGGGAPAGGGAGSWSRATTDPSVGPGWPGAAGPGPGWPPDRQPDRPPADAAWWSSTGWNSPSATPPNGPPGPSPVWTTPTGSWSPGPPLTPPQPDRRPGGRRGRIVAGLIAAALVLVAAAGTGGWLLRGGADTGSDGPDAAAIRDEPVPMQATLGEQAAADPCAMLSETGLRRFGEVSTYPDFGSFHSCRMEVSTPAGETLSVVSLFYSREAVVGFRGYRDQTGTVSTISYAPSDTSCERIVVLGDGTAVSLSAARDAAGAADLCAVADAMTVRTLAVLAGGEVPTREIEAGSAALASLDACGLLDDAALATVPGLDLGRRIPGFAGRQCSWGDDPGDGARVAVQIRRDGVLNAENAGTQGMIDGRTTWTEAGDGGSCSTIVVVRAYVGSSGFERTDVIDVEVVPGRPGTDACGQATALAGILSPALPAG